MSDSPRVLYLNHPQLDEQNLISRIRTGDLDAFTIVFDTYSPRLCSFVATHVKSPEIAEEIVQELFLTIWTYRHSWTVPGPLKQYMYKAARNRIANYYRDNKRQRLFYDQWSRNAVGTDAHISGERADDSVSASETAEEIRKAVDKLPERCREIWILSRHHHMSHAEIAEVLDISIKTVEVQIGRALASLKKSLGVL